METTELELQSSAAEQAREQPPSDKTPPRQWLQARAVEFIDAHEQEIRAALTERKTG